MTPRTYLLTKDGDGEANVWSFDSSLRWNESESGSWYWFSPDDDAKMAELNDLHESWADDLRPHFADMPPGSVKAVTLDGELADHLDRVMT